MSAHIANRPPERPVFCFVAAVAAAEYELPTDRYKGASSQVSSSIELSNRLTSAQKLESLRGLSQMRV